MKRIRVTALAFLPILLLLAAMAITAQENGGMSEDTDTLLDSARTNPLFFMINEEYQAVKPILQKSCFDCHSDQTEFPWYHSLPLVGSWMDGHIEEGREHLDLSTDFPFKGKGRPDKLLLEIKEEIEEDNMPLTSYRLVHWNSAIEGADRDSLFAWIDRTLTRLQIMEPIDLPAAENEEEH